MCRASSILQPFPTNGNAFNPMNDCRVGRYSINHVLKGLSPDFLETREQDIPWLKSISSGLVVLAKKTPLYMKLTWIFSRETKRGNVHVKRSVFTQIVCLFGTLRRASTISAIQWRVYFMYVSREMVFSH